MYIGYPPIGDVHQCTLFSQNRDSRVNTLLWAVPVPSVPTPEWGNIQADDLGNFGLGKGHFGPFWAYFGPFWAYSGRFGPLLTHFKRFWTHFIPFWCHFESSVAVCEQKSGKFGPKRVPSFQAKFGGIPRCGPPSCLRAVLGGFETLRGYFWTFALCGVPFGTCARTMGAGERMYTTPPSASALRQALVYVWTACEPLPAEARCTWRHRFQCGQWGQQVTILASGVYLVEKDTHHFWCGFINTTLKIQYNWKEFWSCLRVG